MKNLSKRRQKGLRKFFQEKEARKASRQLSNRSDPESGQRESVVRLLAPNLDQLVIVTSFGVPAFKPGIVDRLLVLASIEAVPVVLVINKADLGERSQVEAAARLYRAFGTDTLVCSATHGEGVELLKQRLVNKVSGLCGHSGVGKSSLLEAVEPGLRGVVTGAVSDSIKKGQHTTTEVRSFPLKAGGRVFDLPGLKLAPVRGIGRSELSEHFPDFFSAARNCRFNDCVHDQEPGCGVKSELELGFIEESRYRSYLRLLGEL